MTATQLYALRLGLQESGSSERCFYCGGRCGHETPAADFVPPSFTALDATTGSGYVCRGCVTTQDERATITLLDGETRDGQRIRCYSWVVTDVVRAATKAHRAALLELCLSPPAPPYVMCFSDSGQRHLLYKARVCRSTEIAIASLEGDVIHYRPVDLRVRLTLCRRLARVVGKMPLLDGPLDVPTALRICEAIGDYAPIENWNVIAEQPLSRLAAWLCPPKEECLLGNRTT